MTREIFTCIFTLRAGSRCLQPTPIDVRGLAPPPRNVDPHFPLSIIQSSIQSSNLNHPISIIQSSIHARRIVVGRSAAAAILSNRPFVVRAHNARPRSSRIVRERAAGSRASHPRRGSPVVAPAPTIFSASRRRTDPSAASRIASRTQPDAARRRHRRTTRRPASPRRCRKKWPPSAARLARARSLVRAVAAPPPEGRRVRRGERARPRAPAAPGAPTTPRLVKSHAALEHGVSRGRSGSGRASSVAGRAARANAPDGRRGPRGPRVAGRQRPARMFRRRTSLPRRTGRAPRSAAPARGGIQSSVEECCPGCCPRSPARRSGRSSAGTRSREGFIEPRARVPRPRMRLPSALFGVGSVRERETGVVAACCLESPNQQHCIDRAQSRDRKQSSFLNRAAPRASTGAAQQRRHSPPTEHTHQSETTA